MQEPLSQVSSGIRISVLSRFEPGVSNPASESYVFSYHIFIQNDNEYAVKLTRRHWFIFDSCGIESEVEGAGVIGETPVIEPNTVYQYSSGCSLRSPFGTMQGYYSMEVQGGIRTFRVQVPKFILQVPYLLN
jgi:ApaG protein